MTIISFQQIIIIIRLIQKDEEGKNLIICKYWTNNESIIFLLLQFNIPDWFDLLSQHKYDLNRVHRILLNK